MSPCPSQETLQWLCRRAQHGRTAERHGACASLRSVPASARSADGLAEKSPAAAVLGRQTQSCSFQMAKQEPGRRTDSRSARLRGAGGTGSGRHGCGLQGTAGRPRPDRRLENDPGRRPRRSASWPASVRKPKPSPRCSIPTSCRSTTSARTRACPNFSLEFIEGGSLDKKARQHAAGTEAIGHKSWRHWRARCKRRTSGRHPPRPEAGQRAGGKGWC